MRLWEITTPTRALYATNRFKKELVSELRVDPSLRKTFLEFLQFRETARPDAAFNAKDYGFRHGDLKGYRHCHLAHRTSIVIYKVDNAAIYLAALTDHAQYDGYNPKIAPFLRGLTSGDFDPFNVEVRATKPVVSPMLAKEIKDLAYSMTQGDDRQFLEDLAKGKPEHFFVFTRMLPATDEQVVTAFGSREAMISFARKVLNDTEMSESRRFRRVTV